VLSHIIATSEDLSTLPPRHRARYGLDWMNFFVADVQTGFGAFVAFLRKIK
jgi:hypothetical protein